MCMYLSPSITYIYIYVYTITCNYRCYHILIHSVMLWEAVKLAREELEAAKAEAQAAI